MLQKEGYVKRIDGDIAKVVFPKPGGCGGGCSSCSSHCPKDTLTIDLKNTQDASVGDRVVVDMDAKAFNNLTLWAYAFPTAVTVVVLSLCLYLFNKFNVNNYEVYSCLIALASTFISYRIGAAINKGKDNKFDFQMIKKLHR